MLATGTRTSSKTSSAVSDPRMPSLSSLRLTENPAASVGMMIWLTPREPPSSEVRTSAHSQSAWVPLVMYSLAPEMIQSSPSRAARVVSAATSEPASGSVTAIAATASPVMAGARYCCFSSAEPNAASAGVAMSVCTPIAIGMPIDSERPSSSNRSSVYRWSAPPPPSASSYSKPSSPRAPILVNSSWAGKVPSASHVSTWGLISVSTNERTVDRNSSCSSVKVIMA